MVEAAAFEFSDTSDFLQAGNPQRLIQFEISGEAAQTHQLCAICGGRNSCLTGQLHKGFISQ